MRKVALLSIKSPNISLAQKGKFIYKKNKEKTYGVFAMVTICSNEINRLAKRLVRKLLRCNGYLEQSLGHPDPSGGWGLMSTRNNYSRPVETVAGELVQQMLSRDWLSPTPAGTLRVANGASRLWQSDPLISARAQNANLKNFMITRREFDETGSMRELTVNGAENPLVWLRHRKDRSGKRFISQAELDAGEQFRHDYERAQLEPATTANWQAFLRASKRCGAGIPQVQADLPNRALAAKQRFYKAVDALGSELSPIAVEVCCLSNGLEAAERRLGYARRSGKLVLRNALRKLARHYGLLPNIQGSGMPSKILLDAKPGYRPKI